MSSIVCILFENGKLSNQIATLLPIVAKLYMFHRQVITKMCMFSGLDHPMNILVHSAKVVRVLVSLGPKFESQ